MFRSSQPLHRHRRLTTKQSEAANALSRSWDLLGGGGVEQPAPHHVAPELRRVRERGAAALVLGGEAKGAKGALGQGFLASFAWRHGGRVVVQQKLVVRNGSLLILHILQFKRFARTLA